MTSTVEIASLAHGGFGVCRIDGQVCFVPYALPGDVLSIRIERQSKGVLWGAIEQVVQSSPHRSKADCPVFGRCGGCTWLHFAYPEQAQWKAKIVADLFKRIARCDVDVEWQEDDTLRLGYRTRAEFHGHDGKWGFYEGMSHRVVEIRACPLCHPKLNQAFTTLRSLKLKTSVEIVANSLGDEVLVWTRNRERLLVAGFPNYNFRNDGKPRSAFSFDNRIITNGTFCQSSLLLNRLLLRVVRELLGSPNSVLDLYCGNGNLTVDLDANVNVRGLDHNAVGIAAANRSRPDSYSTADETAFATAITERKWDVVLLDPPRTGARAIVNSLASANADALVYVSCDPATLARDVGALINSGWRIDRVVAVDLFPHTAHIEIICRLVR